VAQKGGQSKLFNRNFLSCAIFFFICIAAIYSILRPNNPFDHYQVLLFAPLTIFYGYFIKLLVTQRKNASISLYKLQKKSVFIFFIALTLLQTAASVAIGNPFFKKMERYKLENVPSAASRAIKERLEPDDYMAVWGWNVKLYMEAEAVPATRQVHTIRLIKSGEQNEFYVRTYIADLKRTRPKIFADASVDFRETGEYELWKFANIPPLKDYIDSNYVEYATIEGISIYLRKDAFDSSIFMLDKK
jgi:hypothetical protein